MRISKSVLLLLSVGLTVLAACDDKGGSKPAGSASAGSSTPARAEKPKASGAAPAASASAGGSAGGW